MTAALTLADAARMMREAVKDRSYVDETGLGRSVDGFLAYFRTERGKKVGLKKEERRDSD